MYPYQVYKVLADQHIRDLTADARSHGRLTATQPVATDPAGRSSHLRDSVAHLVAAVLVPKRRAAGSVEWAVGAGSAGRAVDAARADRAGRTRATSAAASTRVPTPAAAPMGCAG